MIRFVQIYHCSERQVVRIYIYLYTILSCAFYSLDFPLGNKTQNKANQIDKVQTRD